MTPEVPTSRRWTIPSRSLAPEVEIRKPAPARWPTTVGPDQPGDGCTATPTGLSITTIDSSSWMILIRSEEHTSELQSRRDVVCRLLLEKKKKQNIYSMSILTYCQIY